MTDKISSKITWENYSGENLLELEELCNGYKSFISSNKTERECVNYFINECIKHNFKDLREVIERGEKLKKGDRVYYSKMDKTLILAIIGEENLENGFNIIGSHIDAPRVDIKQSPVYEVDGLCYFDTHYYGGIKKYHWVARPMCLKGVVIKSNGDKVTIDIGDGENDPYIGFSDLLPHLWKDQAMKKGVDVIEGEQLNLLVGSKPSNSEKNKVKNAILSILNEKYGIYEEDLISSELEAVPAGPAKDYGLDRSMIIGYGQDDRVCAFTSFMAMLRINEMPKRTSVCILVDKEEIGSTGATGMDSKLFENFSAEILNCCLDNYSDLILRRALDRSYMLSADVTCAYDANFPNETPKQSTAFFGKGVAISKYTGSRGKSGCNDANPEFLGKLRNIFNKEGVYYQVGELGKVDQGGGGTIAYFLSRYGMEVVDIGVPLQNMHAPFEVASKADIYEAYRAYRTFYRDLV
ncbi:aminopeptidase [Candidatus Arthromitus sp. SFB-rat-Yit]|uniref:aminopeptidase n=1 Tax=Candidatus Arthromitus sp. SFB-rat-Yit TaxID=1041504 RepID=UPI000227A2F6|nr:aminopeptidase [Candidatus Arthromitus sp. SFB-rat-Yit]BAK80834.1 peptidase M18 [Candidatus Arthromitus sp. SFB-rat-Yit]